MDAPNEIKAHNAPNQYSEAEIEAAWEIRNNTINGVEDTDKWTEQYEVTDDDLRIFINALTTTGVPFEQIGDVAAALRQKTEPKDPNGLDPIVGFDEPPEWRDPLMLTSPWRLEFVTWAGTLDFKTNFAEFMRMIARSSNKPDEAYIWSNILEQRLQAEADRPQLEAEERARVAADPYQCVWADDRPLLLGYHDRHCLLPKYRDGGIGLIVGEKNHLKTTVMIMLLVEAMVANPRLCILYLAGEQPGDVLNKVRHYGTAAGLTVADMRIRFRIRDGLPPLHLPENASQLVKNAGWFGASIVVVDTYQHAITGLDENSSKAAELSTNGGIFGQLKGRGYLVLILGHPPADGSPRFRGNTGIEGAADFVITFRATHSKGSFKAEVINMRGSAAGALAHGTFPKVPATLTAEERLVLPPPDISWATPREYNAVTHDPRPSVPPSVQPPAERRELTRTEKAAERKRRQRERERA